MTERAHIHQDTGLPVEVDQGDDDLAQTDTHPAVWPAVAVSVEGIARVRSLPARRMQLGTQFVPPGGVPQLLLGRYDQRQTVCIFAVDQAVVLFVEQPATGSTSGFTLPAGASLAVDYCGPVYVLNNSAATPATVSYYFTFAEE